MATKNTGSKAAREAAHAARIQARAEQKSRERKIQLIGGLAVIVIVVALISIGISTARKTAGGVDPSAAKPKSVSSDTYGVQVGKAWSAPNADSIPKLQLWEDFQCPACKKLEDTSGEEISALANSGKIRLEYRPTTFLDANLAQMNGANKNPQSSLLATIGLGCAADAGKAMEYHATVFALQPEEGKGFNVNEIRYFGQLAGIKDKKLDRFTDCIANRTYEGWAKNSYAKFNYEGIMSTPTGILNGTKLDEKVLYDPAKLTKAIEEAAKSAK